MCDQAHMREFFAAHAPQQIPDWFKGERSGDLPSVPDAPLGWGAAKSAEFLELKEGRLERAASSPEVMAFFDIWRVARDAQAAWRDRQREKKYFAWRWHYADQMMATMEKKNV